MTKRAFSKLLSTLFVALSSLKGCASACGTYKFYVGRDVTYLSSQGSFRLLLPKGNQYLRQH